jgi:hypothetical protein
MVMMLNLQIKHGKSIIIYEKINQVFSRFFVHVNDKKTWIEVDL